MQDSIVVGGSLARMLWHATDQPSTCESDLMLNINEAMLPSLTYPVISYPLW